MISISLLFKLNPSVSSTGAYWHQRRSLRATIVIHAGCWNAGVQLVSIIMMFPEQMTAMPE